jgi:hypothetical protein
VFSDLFSFFHTNGVKWRPKKGFRPSLVVVEENSDGENNPKPPLAKNEISICVRITFTSGNYTLIRVLQSNMSVSSTIIPGGSGESGGSGGNEGEHLLQVIKMLSIENAQLKKSLATMKNTNKELQDKQLQYHFHVEEIDNLKMLAAELRLENAALKIEKDLLIEKLDTFEARLHAVETRDEPKSVREAMRILERHICLASAPSTSQFKKKFYNFDKINTSKDLVVQARLKTELTRVGLSNDEIEMLGYLKDCGDFSAHCERPQLTFSEWEEFIQSPTIGSEVEDSETLEENAAKLRLLAALSSYIPVESNRHWKIEDPIEKPKAPVLKRLVGEK